MAFLIPQGTLTTLQAGPFLSATDGITVLPSLTITPSDRRLSLNGAAFVPSTALDNAIYLTEGYYSFTLSAVDTQTLGLLRVPISKPGAVPVWLDAVIVPVSVSQILAGVPAALLLLQDTPVTITLGPFVATTDGVTLQNALTIPPSEVQLSKNDGTFTTSTTTSTALAIGDGYYTVALPAADVHALGDMRVSVTLPGSMPVWADYTVLSAAQWNFYFAPMAPAVIVPPGQAVPTSPPPYGLRACSALYPGVSALLDDPQQLRADEATLLRFLTRAQQWVALRYRLLIHTFPLETMAGVPWYSLPPLLPQLVVVTEVTDATGSMLTPVPLPRLRYSDPQWLQTSGTPTRWYRVGWTTIGLYKVPNTYGQFSVTGVTLPRRLTEGAQPMETPVSYDDAVMQVAAGLLLIGHERKYAKGLALISQGLARPLGAPAAPEPAGASA